MITNNYTPGYPTEISAMRGSLDLRGLSTDQKPTTNIPNGSTFIEIDTGKVFMFNETASGWVEL